MRSPTPADAGSAYVIEFCQRIAPHDVPLRVVHEPLPNQPLLECFRIVPEQIAAHGGKQLTGWAVWETPGVFIEAEFHAVWQQPDGTLRDVTPRPLPFDQILFVPDSRREYAGRQVDNIRQSLVDDRDVVRFLYLAKRRFEILNKGDLADQHGEIRLPPRALKEYRNVQKEMMQLQHRLHRRYP